MGVVMRPCRLGVDCRGGGNKTGDITPNWWYNPVAFHNEGWFAAFRSGKGQPDLIVNCNWHNGRRSLPIKEEMFVGVSYVQTGLAKVGSGVLSEFWKKVCGKIGNLRDYCACPRFHSTSLRRRGLYISDVMCVKWRWSCGCVTGWWQVFKFSVSFLSLLFFHINTSFFVLLCVGEMVRGTT